MLLQLQGRTKMKNGVLLLALVFGALMQCCLAIECYDCLTDSEGECKDPFDKDGVTKDSCDGVCMKMKVKGKRKQCTHSAKLTRISVSASIVCLPKPTVLVYLYHCARFE